MKALLFLFLVNAIEAQVSTPIEQFEGYIFTFKNKDYITQHLGTTYPHFRIYWRDARVKNEVCISAKAGECPTYKISFRKEKNQNGDFVFANVQIVSPLDDPSYQVEYLKTPDASKAKK